MHAINRRNIWRWIPWAFLILVIYGFVELLPKPETICCDQGDYGPHDPGYDKWDVILNQHRLANQAKQVVSEKNFYIDSENSYVLSMFPLYKGLKESIPVPKSQTQSDSTDDDKEALVHIFYLQNLNFTNFGRAWLNDVPHTPNSNSSSGKDTLPEANRAQYGVSEGSRNDPTSKSGRIGGAAVNWFGHHDKLRGKERGSKDLPDCVSLKVPADIPPTKICVHFPHVDNFISNALRDNGEWEGEHLGHMRDFFLIHPHTQLVDLGCNIGVFTVYAASMGIPVLAVDILPANLALIHLSIAINDAREEGYDLENQSLVDYIREYLRRKEYNSKSDGSSGKSLLNSGVFSHKDSRPRFSDLITTLHNAVYNKRKQMYVHLKDDLNLGGTEVHELNPTPSEVVRNSSDNVILRKLQSVSNRPVKFSRFSGKKRKQVNRNDSKDQQGSKKQIPSGKIRHRYYKKSDSKKINSYWLSNQKIQISNTGADQIPNLESPPRSSVLEDQGKSGNNGSGQQQTVPATKILVDGVCLDDLIPYLREKRAVFLKMDVEGSEAKILRCASRFFMEVDVRVMLLEIIFHKYTAEGRQMVLYLLQHNMLPAADALGKDMLDPSKIWSWPDNVYWIKGR